MPDTNSIAIPPRVKDLTGSPPFGRLTVVAYAGSVGGHARWLCRCECGATTFAMSSNLLRHTRSCGCLVSDTIGARNTTHSKSGTPEHNCWGHIIQRCHNPNCPEYIRYGARGITVCERWRTSFEAFYEDMGPRPDGHRISVERIENDGNYEPGNCKWATIKEQNNNKRTTIRLTFRGRTQCLSAWAEEFGIALERLRKRLKVGWSTERALTEPVDHRRDSASSLTPSL